MADYSEPASPHRAPRSPGDAAPRYRISDTEDGELASPARL